MGLAVFGSNAHATQVTWANWGDATYYRIHLTIDKTSVEAGGEKYQNLVFVNK